VVLCLAEPEDAEAFAEGFIGESVADGGRCSGAILGRCKDLAFRQPARDEAIAETIDDDPDLRRQRDLLLSISGVGETLAGVVLAELPGPNVLRSSSEVAAYAGLNPRRPAFGLLCLKKLHKLHELHTGPA
jgi:transposase